MKDLMEVSVTKWLIMQPRPQGLLLDDFQNGVEEKALGTRLINYATNYKFIDACTNKGAIDGVTSSPCIITLIFVAITPYIS